MYLIVIFKYFNEKIYCLKQHKIILVNIALIFFIYTGNLFIKKTAENFFLHDKSQNWEDSKWACQKKFLTRLFFII